MRRVIKITLVAAIAAVLIRDRLRKMMDADMPEWMRGQINK